MSTNSVALNFSDLFRKGFTALFITMLVFYLPDALADGGLPVGGDIGVPGAGDDANLATLIVAIVKWGIFIMAIIGLGFGLSGSIFTLFRLVNDARTNEGGWGPVVNQMLIILVIIAVALALFGVINKFVFEPLENFVSS